MRTGSGGACRRRLHPRQAARLCAPCPALERRPHRALSTSCAATRPWLAAAYSSAAAAAAARCGGAAPASPPTSLNTSSSALKNRWLR